MKRPVTVFICSTFSDLSGEREAVMNAVRRLQLRHDSMEFFGARSGQPLETCLSEVRKSDVLVVIVGHLYGTITPEKRISFSEAEYDEGYRLRKPCLVYIRDDEVPILPRLMETDPDKLRLLNRWKTVLRNRHTIAPFKQKDDLAVQVAADLSRAANDLDEAEEDRDKSRATDRSLGEEVNMLLSQARERGLDEDTIVSVIRHGLTSAIASEASKGPRVFLSYSNADKAIVREFAHGLDQRGVYVWFDEMRLHAGEDWNTAIREAIDSSDYIAFFISGNSMRRGYVQKELKTAFERSRMMPAGGVFILPVLLDRTAISDMPPLLRDIQWLDATDGDIPKAINRLYEAVLMPRDREAQRWAQLAAVRGQPKDFSQFDRTVDYTQDFLDETRT